MRPVWSEAVAAERPTPRVLGYHELSMVESDDVYAVTRAQFFAQVRAARLAGMENALPVEFTFDDGHVSQVEIAATALESVALRGVFFVPSAWVGTRAEVVTAEQLRRLVAAGHEVGAHGDTHCLLTMCGAGELEGELGRSRDRLQQMLGVEIHKMSVPGGRVDARVLRAARMAGFDDLYTSEPQPANCTWAEQDRWTPRVIGRLVVRRGMTPELVAAYVASEPDTMANLRAEFMMKGVLKRLVGDSLYEFAWRRFFRSPEGVQAHG